MITTNDLKNVQDAELIVKKNQQVRNIQQAQEIIYRFLVEIVKQWPPEAVLEEFKRLFILHLDSVSSDSIQAIYEIVFTNNEEEFRNTIKRCCYILINNWETHRQYKYIQQLVEVFANLNNRRKSCSPALNKLKSWVESFVNSKDYQELKLFASRYDEHDKGHWSERYTSYLLVAQYADQTNPIEQREAARARAKHLKHRFKFELAMYIARSQAVTVNKIPKNPTGLGDEVLRLIKTIVVKRGSFSYANIANIFVNQTKEQKYKQFKQSLQKYLIFSVQNPEFIDILQGKLDQKLEKLYDKYNEEPINDALLLRTCNRLIDYLTTENHQEPSPLFILLMSQGNPLTLVIVLLKIILICKYARTHLEACIAELIRYYENYPEQECNWIINFLEIFNITFSIYADNVEYNLIKMEAKSDNTEAEVLDSYRVYSQVKEDQKLEVVTESAVAEIPV